MTKMATVHAQQMWEYMSLTRKTEDFLVIELNEVGKLGWELVHAANHKDVKSVGGSYCWTALLKRPLVPQAHPTSSDESAAVAAPQAGGMVVSMPTDADSSVFEVRDEQPPPEDEGDVTN